MKFFSWVRQKGGIAMKIKDKYIEIGKRNNFCTPRTAINWEKFIFLSTI